MWQFEHLSVRFEEDIVRITQQLETARREKSEAQRHQDASGEELEELKQELVGLKGLYDGLNDKRELEIKSFELEQEKWKATLDQLRRDNDAFVQEVRLGALINQTTVLLHESTGLANSVILTFSIDHDRKATARQVPGGCKPKPRV